MARYHCKFLHDGPILTRYSKITARLKIKIESWQDHDKILIRSRRNLDKVVKDHGKMGA